MSGVTVGGHEGLAERRNVTVGPLTQSVLGLVAVILGIVGLAITAQNPAVPQYIGAVASIALGISLVFVGATLVVSYARMAAAARGTTAEGPMVGTTVDLFLGGAIVILGVLALLRVDTPLLLAIQAILVGVGLMMSSAAAIRLASIEIDATTSDNPMARRVAEEVVLATSSVRIIAGIAVTILGIIAVTGFAAVTLALAAAIVAGSALVLNSSALSMRVAGLLSAH